MAECVYRHTAPDGRMCDECEIAAEHKTKKEGANRGQDHRKNECRYAACD